MRALGLAGFFVLGCGVGEPSPFGDVEPQQATVFAPGVISDSTSTEFGITFTPDGTTAYFTSQKGSDAFYSIYEARFEDGAWRGPWVAPFSGDYFDADAFVTPDGERLLFFSMRPVEDSTPLEIPDIWYVDREDGGWGEPVNAGAPVNRPESGEAYVTTTSDGTLYFSSVNRGDATGGHDVYRATKMGRGYSDPEYLDLAIETRFSNPLIAPSEDYLVIDSMQGGGFGGNDLYVCFRSGDGWSGPRNLGPLVNTAGDEGTPALSPDGRLLFFSRDGDIYYIAVAAVEALGIR